MSTDDNKALLKRMHGMIGEQNVEGMLALMTDDAVDHTIPPGFPPGKEGIRAVLGMWIGAFSDLKIHPVQMVAEGDLVAVHVRCTGKHTGELMGNPPTQKSIDITLTEIIRFENGKVKERWATEDNAGMFMQLGIQPPAPPGG